MYMYRSTIIVLWYGTTGTVQLYGTSVHVQLYMYSCVHMYVVRRNFLRVYVYSPTVRTAILSSKSGTAEHSRFRAPEPVESAASVFVR